MKPIKWVASSSLQSSEPNLGLIVFFIVQDITSYILVVRMYAFVVLKMWGSGLLVSVLLVQVVLSLDNK